MGSRRRPGFGKLSGMAVIFDGDIDVHYGFLYVKPQGSPPDLVAARGGQVNGLCGAALTGLLALTTGLHTGSVPIRVETHATDPAIDDRWEDVVEASFTTTQVDLYLEAFQESVDLTFSQPGTYRVRYCATGMDAAHNGGRMDGDPAPDHYLLQFWPAPNASDVIVRQTSEYAAYWHGVARTTPAHPPTLPPPTPHELADAAQAAFRQRGDDIRQRMLAGQELRKWGGQEPTDRLRAIGGRTAQLARLDRDLVDALADLDADSQRSIARWAARWACATVGQDHEQPFAGALDALDRGDPLPAPFNDRRTVWAEMFPGPMTISVDVVQPGQSSDRPRSAPKATAIGTVIEAGNADPAAAAIGAVDAASDLEHDRTRFFAEVRRRFLT